MNTAPIRVEIDGREPRLEELYHPILANYGHFTAMQVRGGRVRGLEPHLDRLAAATRELFGAELDTGLVRARLAHAIRDVPDAAVRINVYRPDELMVVVVVRPPTPAPPAPVSLRSVRYERPAAHLKHVGGFGQRYHGRRAEAEGFDDALLTDHTGAIEESAIANIGFFDGAGVTWPTAPHLPGIAMGLLAPRLPAAGLPSRRAQVLLADLPSYRAAFVVNSIGITAVHRIDDVDYGVDAGLMRRLAEAEAGIPWDEIRA
ncbi:aminotransferase class IV [Dactylosporangium sp. NPDC000555]|uniref:aminotransferase class IV n=1 Tax=Dactylosporangium sp. NPDC000555 TaxID=3154260 RepID=UPI0033301604